MSDGSSCLRGVPYVRASGETVNPNLFLFGGNMISIKKSLHKLVQDESGQDMVEYALVAGFISLAGIASFSGIAASITKIFQTIATNLNTAAGS